MKRLLKDYQVSGSGVERLLNVLEKEGFHLQDIARKKKQRLDFSAPLDQSARLEESLKSMGFSFQVLPARGLLKRVVSFHRNRFLIVISGLLLMAALCSLRFIWKINITGAGSYLGEVNGYLRECGIAPFVYKGSLDLQKLCEDLLYRLPRVAWVRAEIRGVELEIRITQGVPQPAVISDTDAGNVTAALDGVVQSILVFRGTAMVKPGDTVKQGQVLIAGKENREAGKEALVQAGGKVYARTWRSADAFVSAERLRESATGRESETSRLVTPWGTVVSQPSPDYLTYDQEIRRIYIGEAWVPLWLEKVKYKEIALEKIPEDIEATKAEAGALAMRKLLSLCGKNDEIIDKWLNFCMIEGDTIQATATAELMTEIGVYTPQISN